MIRFSRQGVSLFKVPGHQTSMAEMARQTRPHLLINNDNVYHHNVYHPTLDRYLFRSDVGVLGRIRV